MLKVDILDIGYLFLLMAFVPRKVVLLKKDDWYDLLGVSKYFHTSITITNYEI